MTSRLHDEPERRAKRSRDAFVSALSAIRGQLRRGDYVLGEALNIKNLSQSLRLSPTPIREALARLSGEGLVEERRGAGYFAPQLGVTELAELYEAHQVLVLSVFRDQRALAEPAAGPEKSGATRHRRRLGTAPTYLERVEGLFDAIVRQGGNRPLFESYRRVADRLAPARLAEGLALDDLDDELVQLRHAAEWDLNAAPAKVRMFHKRRLRHVQDIVRSIRSQKHHEYNTNID